MLAQQPFDQLADVRITQRRKREGMRPRDARQDPRIFGSVDDEQRRLHSGYRRGEVGQQQLADAVDPLGVLDDVERRLLTCQ